MVSPHEDFHDSISSLFLHLSLDVESGIDLIQVGDEIGGPPVSSQSVGDKQAANLKDV
jgi:hypothetical protein